MAALACKFFAGRRRPGRPGRLPGDLVAERAVGGDVRHAVGHHALDQLAVDHRFAALHPLAARSTARVRARSAAPTVRAPIISRSSTNESRVSSSPRRSPPSTARAPPTSVEHELGVLVDEGVDVARHVRASARRGCPRRPGTSWGACSGSHVREHDQEVGDVADGDEPLLAVDDVAAVAVGRRGGRGRREADPASASEMATASRRSPRRRGSGNARAARGWRVRSGLAGRHTVSHRALVSLPSSSWTTTCSSTVSPWPPHSAGMLMARRPESRTAALIDGVRLRRKSVVASALVLKRHDLLGEGAGALLEVKQLWAVCEFHFLTIPFERMVGVKLRRRIAVPESRDRQIEERRAALDQLVGDDNPLDLRSAFPDAIDPDLAVHRRWGYARS